MIVSNTIFCKLHYKVLYSYVDMYCFMYFQPIEIAARVFELQNGPLLRKSTSRRALFIGF